MRGGAGRWELTSWDGLLDFLSPSASVDLEGNEVLGGSELELSDILVLLILLDDDLLGLGQVLELLAVLGSTHDVNELLQILDLLWLYKQKNTIRLLHPRYSH